MKRIIGWVGVLALAIGTIGPVSAHSQLVPDGTMDAIDYSQDPDGDSSGVGTTAIPSDLVGASFKDTKSSFVFSLETAGPQNVSTLCPSGCNNDYEAPANIGFVEIYFYMLKKGDTKAEWVFNYYPLDGEMRYFFNKFSANETRLEGEGWDFSVDETETAVALTIDRDILKPYKKGEKMYWNVRGWWYGNSESGTCVLTEGGPYFDGACIDWLPNAADAKHKLKK